MKRPSGPPRVVWPAPTVRRLEADMPMGLRVRRVLFLAFWGFGVLCMLVLVSDARAQPAPFTRSLGETVTTCTGSPGPVFVTPPAGAWRGELFHRAPGFVDATQGMAELPDDTGATPLEAYCQTEGCFTPDGGETWSCVVPFDLVVKWWALPLPDPEPPASSASGAGLTEETFVTWSSLFAGLGAMFLFAVGVFQGKGVA